MRKTIWIIVAVIIIVTLASSGWIYNIVVKNNQLLESNEIASLQTTFVQQYGSEAVIKQLVSPDKVYAALWTDKSGVAHVSWNIGGLWVMVYTGEVPSSTP